MASNKLWNTGVDAFGVPLAPGSPDLNWRLIRGPGVKFPQQAIVLADQRVGNYYQTPDSMWIWADITGFGDTTSFYVFQTEFYMEVGPAFYLVINGQWAADNHGQFTIDQMPLPFGAGFGATSLPPGGTTDNYDKMHHFSITQAHPGGRSWLPLGVGYHTFEVWVYNEGAPGDDDPVTNPAGFNVSALNIEVHTVLQVPHGGRVLGT